MADTDRSHEAVERLEHLDRPNKDRANSDVRAGFDRRAFLRRTALTGVAAGSVSTILAACGSSASSEQRSSSRNLRLASELQIHLRQPRHDEPVLRPDAVRHPGRLQTARVQLHSGPARKPATSARWSTRSTARSRPRADGIAVSLIDLTAFNGPVESALSRGDPGRLLQRRRRTARQRTSGVHRAEPRSVRRKDGRTHRRTRAGRRRRAVHRDAGLAEHPAPHQRRAEDAQEAPVDQNPHDRHGRRGPAGAHGDRIVSGGPSRTRRACSPSTPARPRASQRRFRRTAPRAKSRAAATTFSKTPRSCSPKATSSSRSTSSPTCRASCRRSSCSSTRCPRR